MGLRLIEMCFTLWLQTGHTSVCIWTTWGSCQSADSELLCFSSSLVKVIALGHTCTAKGPGQTFDSTSTGAQSQPGHWASLVWTRRGFRNFDGPQVTAAAARVRSWCTHAHMHACTHARTCFWGWEWNLVFFQSLQNLILPGLSPNRLQFTALASSPEASRVSLLRKRKKRNLESQVIDFPFTWLDQSDGHPKKEKINVEFSRDLYKCKTLQLLVYLNPQNTTSSGITSPKW